MDKNKQIFGLTEIQYLRGLVWKDQLDGQYEHEGQYSKIDRSMTMYEFTEGILKKLDELENE